MSKFLTKLKNSKLFKTTYTSVVVDVKSMKPAGAREIARALKVDHKTVSYNLIKTEQGLCMPVSEIAGIHNYRKYMIALIQHFKCLDKAMEHIRLSLEEGAMVWPCKTVWKMESDEQIRFADFFDLLSTPLTEKEYLKGFPFKMHKKARSMWTAHKQQRLSNDIVAIQTKHKVKVEEYVPDEVLDARSAAVSSIGSSMYEGFVKDITKALKMPVEKPELKPMEMDELPISEGIGMELTEKMEGWKEEVEDEVVSIEEMLTTTATITPVTVEDVDFVLNGGNSSVVDAAVIDSYWDKEETLPF